MYPPCEMPLRSERQPPLRRMRLLPPKRPFQPTRLQQQAYLLLSLAPGSHMLSSSDSTSPLAHTTSFYLVSSAHSSPRR